MKRLSPLVPILAVLAFMIVVSVLLGRAPQTDPFSDHASFRTNRWGTRALRQLFSSLSLTAHTWALPWTELSDQVKVLWVIHPLQQASEQEVNSLIAWVRRGGWVIIAPDPRPTPEGMVLGDQGADERLLSVLGWRKVFVGRAHQTVPITEAHPLLADVRSVKVPSEWRLRPSEETGLPKHPHDGNRSPGRSPAGSQEPLLYALPRLGRGHELVPDRGGAVAVSIPAGRGTLILLCDADLLSNAHIAEADNAILATNLAFASGADKVWFDEYHHGQAEHKPGVDPRPVRRALAAALLAVALFMVGKFQRFGPPLALKVGPRRSAMESVRAFAALYQQAGQRKAPLEMLVRRLRGRLAVVAGTRADAPAQTLALLAARRHGKLDGARVTALLEWCDAALREDFRLDDSTLLELARAISQLEQELEPHGR